MRRLDGKTAGIIRRKFLKQFSGKTFSLVCSEKNKNERRKVLCTDDSLTLNDNGIKNGRGISIYLTGDNLEMNIHIVNKGVVSFDKWHLASFYFEDEGCIVTARFFQGEMRYEFAVQ